MPRFIQTNGRVRDARSGLVWPADAALSEFPLDWAEALAFVRDLNHSRFQGHDDWRLPNRRELFSLVSHQAVNPCIAPPHPFVNVFHGYYWTATTCARLPDQAWYIHMGGARVFKGMKPNSYMLWPVRIPAGSAARVLRTGQRRCYGPNGDIIGCSGTGQDGELCSGLGWDEPRFTEGKDLVRDRATGLTWLKDADLPGGMRDWPSALDWVRRLNTESAFGHDDWRVPEIRELEGLVDLGRHTPALPAGHPFVNVRDFYWSCTTSRYDTRYAWALYLVDGMVGVGYKPLREFYLWPVRSSAQPSPARS